MAPAIPDLSSLTPDQQEALLNGPALTPPVGITPNFDHPPNQNWIGIFAVVVCLLATVVAASLRAYAKILFMKKVRIEDYLAAAVLGTYVGSIYCCLYLVHNTGIFVHQWDVQLKGIPDILYILHIGANLCAITILVLKAAILLEWIRIFVPYGTRNSFFWTCSTVMILHTLFHAAWIVTENLACMPHEKIWNIFIPYGTCIDVNGLYVPAAAVNLAADIVIFVLPQKAIWSLQMSKKNKIGVSMIFTIGFFACLAATLRLYASIIFYRSDDQVYTAAAMYLWVLAEMTCLFLVYCVPAIPKAFSDHLDLRSRVKTLIPLSFSGWHTKSEDTGSDLSRRRGFANRPAAGFYRQYGKDVSDILRTPSIKSARGLVTEIKADTPLHNGRAYQGPVGILCTTEFRAEITQMEECHVVIDGNNAYHQHQWSMVH
ncbi:hypothetical protein GGR57DRAFT_184992 [Xylariaceae sp. FL1272]|nr:hypothetical protein GGR57DRAFT_184992 [Xylariaceae sp. FL1272]